jgi:hypothetical protein
MKYLYQSFEENGWDFVWEIIDGNLTYASKLNLENIDESLNDYELIKERLIIRPINYTDNKYELNRCVYRLEGDIALVLYIWLSNTEEYGLTTFKIHKNIFKLWGKDIDEVIDTALVNSNVRAVPRMYNTLSEMENPSYQTGAYMSLGAKYQLAAGMISSVFTTYPYLNGAVSFWYPGVSEKIAQMAGGDYYVAFTGIHEFHVHPISSARPLDILKHLKNMNKNMNKKDEILSRKVYLYHADTKKLEPLEL